MEKELKEYISKRILAIEDLEIQYNALGDTRKASEKNAIKNELIDVLLFDGVNQMKHIGEKLK